MENTLKVAGICALGDLMAQRPAKFSGVVSMTKAHVNWAVSFMRESIKAQIDLVADNIADTPAHHRKLVIIRALRKHSGPMSKRELSRVTQQLTARERDEALDDLIVTGIVNVSSEATKGRAREIITLAAAGR